MKPVRSGLRTHEATGQVAFVGQGVSLRPSLIGGRNKQGPLAELRFVLEETEGVFEFTNV